MARLIPIHTERTNALPFRACVPNLPLRTGGPNAFTLIRTLRLRVGKLHPEFASYRMPLIAGPAANLATVGPRGSNCMLSIRSSCAQGYASVNLILGFLEQRDVALFDPRIHKM